LNSQSKSRIKSSIPTFGPAFFLRQNRPGSRGNRKAGFIARLFYCLPDNTESRIIANKLTQTTEQEVAEGSMLKANSFPFFLSSQPSLDFDVFNRDPFVEILTIEQFLALCEEDPNSIESVELIPPRLGTEGFGGFRVRRKFPVYNLAPL
jgi:hypothetical protein